MKVWFFKDRWKSSSGWKNIFYAVTAQDCHITDGKNLAEAVYMAHDLIADVELFGRRGRRRAGGSAPKKFFTRALKICRRTFSLGGVAHDD